MILIVNLNLAVDHIVEVDELRAGEVQRSRAALAVAGGKGVNVARVLRTLDESFLLTGFLGGRTGELIAEGLRAESLVSECTPIHAESRTCLILHDRRRREQTVINDPGPAISEAEIRAFTATYAHALPRAEWVIINGSLPTDLPADTYAELIQLAHRGGRRVLLDCAGAPLRHALRARPYLVKINATETAELLGEDVTDFAAAARAARRLCEMGADSAMVTLGEQGAAFDVAGSQFMLHAQCVAAQNSVGSGDAALAGLAAGLRRGWPPARIAALAVAAGAANALHGAGQCSAQEIAGLLDQVGQVKVDQVRAN